MLAQAVSYRPPPSDEVVRMREDEKKTMSRRRRKSCRANQKRIRRRRAKEKLFRHYSILYYTYKLAMAIACVGLLWFDLDWPIAAWIGLYVPEKVPRK